MSSDKSLNSFKPGVPHLLDGDVNIAKLRVFIFFPYSLCQVQISVLRPSYCINLEVSCLGTGSKQYKCHQNHIFFQSSKERGLGNVHDSTQEF